MSPLRRAWLAFRLAVVLTLICLAADFFLEWIAWGSAYSAIYTLEIAERSGMVRQS